MVMKYLVIFLSLSMAPVRSQELNIELRSKGDPPMTLHQQQQAQLKTSVPLLNDRNWHQQPSPFRESPYSTQEESMEETGLSIAVDERTFNAIADNAINMGKFVKTAAKDWRGVVDGAAKFVGNSIKVTLAPKKKPSGGGGGFTARITNN